MGDKPTLLPPVMPCPETGQSLRRGTRPFVVRYKGQEAIVDLPGYYPDGAGQSGARWRRYAGGRRHGLSTRDVGDGPG